MLPTQKTPPKSSLSDFSVLVYGKNKFGKCLRGDTLLIHPASARPITIREFVEQMDGTVLTVREAGVVTAQRPCAYLANRAEQLYRLTTQTGRTIEATAGHPFLTRDGWVPLAGLGPPDRVAVIVDYPQLFGHGDTDEELLKLLAYLLSDGTIAASAVFTKRDPAVQMDFEAAAEGKGDEFIEFINEGLAAGPIRDKRAASNKLVAFLKEAGVRGLRSPDRSIPDFVFGLERPKLKLFLNRLFTCDGAIEPLDQVMYTSSSARMVRQIQHLLTRFGIVSVIRTRFEEDDLFGTERADLLIGGKSDVLRFIDQIGFFGEKAIRAEAIRSSLHGIREMREPETQFDRLGPFLFDRIVSVVPTEVAPVYDLTIDGSHNFIANDFVVHNSTFCSKAEDALFLNTEGGLRSLEVFQEPVATWETLLAKCKEIAEGHHPFKTIAIDTVDNAYRLCAEYICQRQKIEHESDLPYSKGYSLVNGEFYRVLTKLTLLPYGLFLISHSQQKEVETRTGKRMVTMPTLPQRAKKLVLGMVDMILFCDVEVGQGTDVEPVYRRVIHTKPSVHYEAGDRTERLPEMIDFDFAKFAAAFERGQLPPPLPQMDPAAAAADPQELASPPVSPAMPTPTATVPAVSPTALRAPAAPAAPTTPETSSTAPATPPRAPTPTESPTPTTPPTPPPASSSPQATPAAAPTPPAPAKASAKPSLVAQANR